MKTTEQGWQMTAIACDAKLLQETMASPSSSVVIDSPVASASCLVNGQVPSCSQPLRLQACLDDFRREAQWRTCDTGRYQCDYVSWGEGPALLFIPGLCDDPWTFILPMARLREHFRCIAYCMPIGNGDGSRLGRYCHEHLVDDLFAVLDDAGIGAAVPLGISFGSTVALAGLHAQPDRFPRAILQGGFARRPLAWAEVMLAAWARWWPGNLDHLPLRRQLFRAARQPSFDRREPEVWQYYLEHDGRQPIAAVAHRARLLHEVDLRPLLPAIRQPVLLICGDRDPLVGQACADELQRGLPNVARAEIEKCGHLPHFTHPEVLSEVVRRFALPGESGRR